jgi:hypothetical protein
MVLHELIQRIKFYNPQEKFSSRIPQNFEMLYTVWASETPIRHIS